MYQDVGGSAMMLHDGSDVVNFLTVCKIGANSQNAGAGLPRRLDGRIQPEGIATNKHNCHPLGRKGKGNGSADPTACTRYNSYFIFPVHAAHFLSGACDLY